MKKIAMLIIYVSKEELLKQFISFLPVTKRLDIHILNNSQNDTLSSLQAKNLFIHSTSMRLGFAQSNNYLLSQIDPNKYDSLILSNYDIITTQENISNFIEFCLNNSNSFVTCKMVDKRGRDWPTKYYFHRALGITSNYKIPKASTVLSGCLLGLPKTVFKQGAIFDPCFFMYNEDIDLSIKFERINKIQIQTITMQHLVSQTSDSIGQLWKLEEYFKSRIYLLQKLNSPFGAFILNYFFALVITSRTLTKLFFNSKP